MGQTESKHLSALSSDEVQVSVNYKHQTTSLGFRTQNQGTVLSPNFATDSQITPHLPRSDLDSKVSNNPKDWPFPFIANSPFFGAPLQVVEERVVPPVPEKKLRIQLTVENILIRIIRQSGRIDVLKTGGMIFRTPNKVSSANVDVACKEWYDNPQALANLALTNSTDPVCKRKEIVPHLNTKDFEYYLIAGEWVVQFTELACILKETHSNVPAFSFANPSKTGYNGILITKRMLPVPDFGCVPPDYNPDSEIKKPLA